MSQHQDSTLNFEGIDPDLFNEPVKQNHSAHHGSWFTQERLFVALGPSVLTRVPPVFALVELACQVLVSPLQPSTPLTFTVCDVGLSGNPLKCVFYPTTQSDIDKILQLESGNLVRCVGLYKKDSFQCFKIEPISLESLDHLRHVAEPNIDQQVPSESDGLSE
jgi:hypothetical protein